MKKGTTKKRVDDKPGTRRLKEGREQVVGAASALVNAAIRAPAFKKSGKEDRERRGG